MDHMAYLCNYDTMHAYGQQRWATRSVTVVFEHAYPKHQQSCDGAWHSYVHNNIGIMWFSVTTQI